MITTIFSPHKTASHFCVSQKTKCPFNLNIFLPQTLYNFPFGIRADRILHQYGKIINVQTPSDAEGTSELNIKTSMVIFKSWILTSEKLSCDSVKHLQTTSPTCNQPVLDVTQRYKVHNSAVKHDLYLPAFDLPLEFNILWQQVKKNSVANAASVLLFNQRKDRHSH